MTARAVRRVDQPFPRFDAMAECEKCGFETVATHYRLAGCLRPDCSVCPPEHLLRVCERCRFSWPEAPVGLSLSDEEREL